MDLLSSRGDCDGDDRPESLELQSHTEDAVEDDADKGREAVDGENISDTSRSTQEEEEEDEYE